MTLRMRPSHILGDSQSDLSTVDIRYVEFYQGLPYIPDVLEGVFLSLSLSLYLSFLIAKLMTL